MCTIENEVFFVVCLAPGRDNAIPLLLRAR